MKLNKFVVLFLITLVFILLSCLCNSFEGIDDTLDSNNNDTMNSNNSNENLSFNNLLNNMSDDLSNNSNSNDNSNSNSNSNFGSGSLNNSNSSSYYPNQGIPKSQIPAGDEDLYILKSEIVPPVCPVCPNIESSGGSMSAKKCPPCPACARCPEPSYECKLVAAPSNNPGAFPKPVLTNFSTFGM